VESEGTSTLLRLSAAAWNVWNTEHDLVSGTNEDVPKQTVDLDTFLQHIVSYKVLRKIIYYIYFENCSNSPLLKMCTHLKATHLIN